MKKQWQLQDAKKYFSKVVEKALYSGPQVIARSGVATAVVLSIHDYEKLTTPQTGLVDFFRNSPLYGVDLDLERDFTLKG